VSQKNVEVVRRHTEPYDGLDLAVVIREGNEGLDLDDPDAASV